MSVVVLISGRGSNLQALLDAGVPVAAVISNRADAKGLQVAAARGVAARTLEHRAFASRESFDAALADEIDRHAPRLVALAAGVKVHGCTVHFVTSELDQGPIIIQAAVAVRPGDTPETLAARVLEQEHVVYPRAVRWFLDGRISVEQGVVRVQGNDAQLVIAARGR